MLNSLTESLDSDQHTEYLMDRQKTDWKGMQRLTYCLSNIATDMPVHKQTSRIKQ